MRWIWAILLLATGALKVQAQTFYFQDTSTILIKNTDQSPAHWYIEIFTNASSDTSLRWKTHFSNIPAAWVINFDNQDVFLPVIEDGDSADFTLFGGLPYAQKLIIGAMLNDTPGNGIVYFDIYDPDAPEYVQTISFRFIVTAVGLDELLEAAPLQLQQNVLSVTGNESAHLQIYDAQGTCLLDQEGQTFSLAHLPESQSVFFRLQIGKDLWVVDWMKP